MVLAADDVGDPHQVIVHHHRALISRQAIGLDQDKIIEEGILKEPLRP